MRVSTGRISLLAEAIGYVGIVLVLAGGGAAIAEKWVDLSESTRILVIAGAALGFFLAGVAARVSAEPALRRLASMAWLLSTAGIGVATALTATWTLDFGTQAVMTATAIVTTGFAAALWVVAPAALQHAALFGAGLLLVESSVAWTARDAPGWSYGIATWVYGAGWAAASWRRVLAPWWAGVPLGLIAALVAPAIIESPEGAMYALGLLTATAVMAAGVATRFTPAIPIGAVGAFAWVTATVSRYASGVIGISSALAVSGVVILGLAVVTGRLMAYAKKPEGKTAATERGLRRVS